MYEKESEHSYGRGVGRTLKTTPTRRVNFERVSLSDFTDDIVRDNVRFLKHIQANSEIEMYVGGLMEGKHYRSHVMML